MWLVVGLGNIGKKYSQTRHNAGFMVIEELIKKFDIYLYKKNNLALGLFQYDKNKILLCKPLTYMNLSGEVIVPFIKKNNIPYEKFIVIHDDIDLPLGRIKIKKGGSSAGHKGVQSIIELLGSLNFIRIKIGIGRPCMGISIETYVIEKFSKKEMELLKIIIPKVADAVIDIIQNGLDKAMSLYNCLRFTFV